MKKTKSTKIKFLRIEKLMFFILAILIIATPVSIIFAKATLSESNIDVEKLNNKISTQKSTNQSLVMQINELASLTNIQAIAKEYGLSYNNDNILVIKQD